MAGNKISERIFRSRGKGDTSKKLLKLKDMKSLKMELTYKLGRALSSLEEGPRKLREIIRLDSDIRAS